MVHKALIHITLKPHNKSKLYITREMKQFKIKVPVKNLFIMLNYLFLY